MGVEQMTRAKLVRDKIPEIIRSNGAEPIVRVADPAEYRGLLRAKLVEEVEEFLVSDSADELADVLEVLLATAADLGLQPAQIEELRADKAAARGGYANRLVWSGNESDVLPKREVRHPVSADYAG